MSKRNRGYMLVVVGLIATLVPSIGYGSAPHQRKSKHRRDHHATHHRRHDFDFIPNSVIPISSFGITNNTGSGSVPSFMPGDVLQTRATRYTTDSTLYLTYRIYKVVNGVPQPGSFSWNYDNDDPTMRAVLNAGSLLHDNKHTLPLTLTPGSYEVSLMDGYGNKIAPFVISTTFAGQQSAFRQFNAVGFSRAAPNYSATITVDDMPIPAGNSIRYTIKVKKTNAKAPDSLYVRMSERSERAGIIRTLGQWLEYVEFEDGQTYATKTGIRALKSNGEDVRLLAKDARGNILGATLVHVIPRP